MKAVKTLQKYKCDFCKKRSVKQAMERHEKRCFRNPNRYCDYCENKGFTIEHYGEDIPGAIDQEIPCPYCEGFDKEKLKEIEEYEKSLPNKEVGEKVG